MGMLAEHADHVIGVDTHRDAHAAAVVATGTGAVGTHTTIAADAFGYKRLLRFARRHARGRRVWAIESSGSYGAGLTMFLLAQGEWVVEVDRPKRRRAATAPSPTSSTRSAPPAKRSSATISPSPALEATARRSACC
jgi:transposase